MREIKFRAWDTEQKMMHNIVQMNSNAQGNFNTVTHRIPMQYTGLKDKNGKEIYEGDILNPGLREIRFLDYAVIDKEFEGTLSQGNGFCSVSHSGEYMAIPYSFCHRQSENCEIIGNIYETPDLLK